MNIVIVGHVDHGKSTVIGRLLADTGSLPQGKLEQIKEMCRRNSKPFEYAFLLDALKDERAQGITIDIARCFFRTEKREYIILDAPGHIEFLKNMITGASRAEAALLVIDAHEGVRENSRRHGYILSMLGIKQVSVLVNKLDIMGYSEEVFNNIVKEYSEFLAAAGVTPTSFIPVSAAMGDNIAVRSDKMPWYDGMTVLEQLDAFKEELPPDDLPFRMPVQDVYKFTSSGDERRIIAGTVESGTLRAGDGIMFYPSGKKTTVATIEEFNRPKRTAVTSGYSTGITMTEQIYVKRGDLAVKTDEKPPVTASRIEVSLFWLGKDALTEGKRYYLKTGSAKVPMRLEKTDYVLNASSLEKTAKPKVEKNEVAKCTLTLERPISFDISSELSGTGRFVIVDGYEISGGGIITGVAGDEKIRQNVLRRNFLWEKGGVSLTERMERFRQKPFVIMITGSKNSDRKTVARELEKLLFANGRSVYYLGIGNVLYGVDADIKTGHSEDRDERDEHIRRLAETANILTDAGLIVILTASEIDEDDVYLMQTVLGEKIFTIRVGNAYDKEPAFDLSVDENDEKAAETIIRSAESMRTAEF